MIILVILICYYFLVILVFFVIIIIIHNILFNIIRPHPYWYYHYQIGSWVEFNLSIREMEINVISFVQNYLLIRP